MPVSATAFDSASGESSSFAQLQIEEWLSLVLPSRPSMEVKKGPAV